MSDSLKETLIVSELVLTISAKLELLDDELDPLDPVEPLELPEPAVPEPAVLELPLELELDPVLLVPVLPADTESPGERLSSETTVPLVGA